MSNNNALTIELSKRTIRISARSNEKFSDHEIQVKLVLAYYWNENFPVVENLLELIEKVIKNSISKVFPHNILKLKYQVVSDDNIKKASSISIEFLEIKADEIDFEILGDLIILKTSNAKSSLSKLKKFRRKKKKIIEKEI